MTRGLIPFTSTEGSPHEDTANRWPTTSQEETSHQKPNWPAPWPWTSRLLNSENINVCCLNHPACGILLWQPKQTNTKWKRVKEESWLASTYDLKNIHEGIQLSMSQYGICVVRLYTWELRGGNWHINVWVKWGIGKWGKMNLMVIGRVYILRAFQVAWVVKISPANAGDTRELSHQGRRPGSERSLGGDHGIPLQYSHPQNHMDRGAWWATVHGITQSQTSWLKQLSMHAHILYWYTPKFNFYFEKIPVP